MKNNRHGQATILSDADYARIFRQIENPSHRLILTVARYTGERWGAILQLRVDDVYANPGASTPHKMLTFRAETRKGDCRGRRTTRQVELHDHLRDALAAYKPPLSGFLFPSPMGEGDRPVSFKAADAWFRRAVERAGLGAKGISTHSTRRSAITKLSRAGVGLPVIQQFSGHRSIEVLRRYIEDDPHQVARAIALL